VIDLSMIKADVELRMIRRGQVATFEVGDTFAREPAPCDGILVETRVTTLLIPLTDVLRIIGEA